jgi:hypothetical protein
VIVIDVIGCSASDIREIKDQNEYTKDSSPQADVEGPAAAAASPDSTPGQSRSEKGNHGQDARATSPPQVGSRRMTLPILAFAFSCMIYRLTLLGPNAAKYGRRIRRLQGK